MSALGIDAVHCFARMSSMFCRQIQQRFRVKQRASLSDYAAAQSYPRQTASALPVHLHLVLNLGVEVGNLAELGAYNYVLVEL